MTSSHTLNSKEAHSATVIPTAIEPKKMTTEKVAAIIILYIDTIYGNVSGVVWCDVVWCDVAWMWFDVWIACHVMKCVCIV